MATKFKIYKQSSALIFTWVLQYPSGVKRYFLYWRHAMNLLNMEIRIYNMAFKND